MPYVLDKGPYFSVIESMLDKPVLRKHALEILRGGRGGVTTGQMLSDLCGFDAQSLSGDGRSLELRVLHLNRDWFGMTNASGQWAKQPNAATTGFWSDYQGDPEAILREGMARAIEVSFGITRTDPLPGEIPSVASWQDAVDWTGNEPSGPHWPIDVNWICQAPWFQCWVLWRKLNDSAVGGKVTLLITTPAAEGFPLTSRITRPITGWKPCPPQYASADTAHDIPLEDRGVWVVGHDDYLPTLTFSTKGSPIAGIPWPSIRWRATDANVVTVRPCEWEGGVRGIGRPYDPA
jgi:hypothetical protein